MPQVLNDFWDYWRSWLENRGHPNVTKLSVDAVAQLVAEDLSDALQDLDIQEFSNFGLAATVAQSSAGQVWGTIDDWLNDNVSPNLKELYARSFAEHIRLQLFNGFSGLPGELRDDLEDLFIILIWNSSNSLFSWAGGGASGGWPVDDGLSDQDREDLIALIAQIKEIVSRIDVEAIASADLFTLILAKIEILPEINLQLTSIAENQENLYALFEAYINSSNETFDLVFEQYFPQILNAFGELKIAIEANGEINTATLKFIQQINNSREENAEINLAIKTIVDVTQLVTIFTSFILDRRTAQIVNTTAMGVSTIAVAILQLAISAISPIGALSAVLSGLFMVFEAFRGGGVPIEERILIAIQQLSKRIESFRREMHDRFDRIEDLLQELYREITTVLITLHNVQDDIQSYTAALFSASNQIANRLATLHADLYTSFRNLYNVELQFQVANALLTLRVYVANFEQDTSTLTVNRRDRILDDYLQLRNWAVLFPLLSAANISLENSQDNSALHAQLDATHTHSQINLLRELMVDGAFVSDFPAVPNPAAYIEAVPLLVQYFHEASKLGNFLDSIAKSDLEQLFNLGARFLHLSGVVRLHKPLFLRMFDQVFSHALGLLESVDREFDDYKQGRSEVFAQMLRASLRQQGALGPQFIVPWRMVRLVYEATGILDLGDDATPENIREMFFREDEREDYRRTSFDLFGFELHPGWRASGFLSQPFNRDEVRIEFPPMTPMLPKDVIDLIYDNVRVSKFEIQAANLETFDYFRDLIKPALERLMTANGYRDRAERFWDFIVANTPDSERYITREEFVAVLTEIDPAFRFKRPNDYEQINENIRQAILNYAQQTTAEFLNDVESTGRGGNDTMVSQLQTVFSLIEGYTKLSYGDDYLVLFRLQVAKEEISRLASLHLAPVLFESEELVRIYVQGFDYALGLPLTLTSGIQLFRRDLLARINEEKKRHFDGTMEAYYPGVRETMAQIALCLQQRFQQSIVDYYEEWSGLSEILDELVGEPPVDFYEIMIELLSEHHSDFLESLVTLSANRGVDLGRTFEMGEVVLNVPEDE